MMYQTDKKWPTDIQRYGCYFLSICYQLDLNFSLGIFDNNDYGKLMTYYEDEEMNHDLGLEVFVKNPQHLCDYILGGKKVEFIGKEDKDFVPTYKHFEILQWLWTKPDGTDSVHFVAGRNGNIIYDPVEGGALTISNGQLDSKRIFKIL